MRGVPLPSRLEGLGNVVSSSSEVWGRDRSKTVLVHIKRRRTPVDEGKLLKIIEKSHKKKITHFPDGVRMHLVHLVWIRHCYAVLNC